MQEEQTELASEHDGSIASAAEAIAGLVDDDDNISDGAAADKAPPVEEEQREVEAATAKDKNKEEEPPTDEDEDWVELPPAAEGEEPQRLKLDDVFEGYQQSKDLTKQLDEARKQQVPPEQFDQALQALVHQRSQYIQAVEQTLQSAQFQEPDIGLLDEASDRYNPGLYAHQRAHLQQAAEQQQLALGALQQQRNLQAQQEAVLHETYRTRELAKLHEFWPEMENTEVQETFQRDLQTHYGVDKALLDTVADSRFFAVAKDALAYRAQAAEAKKAVKAVRAKPKLISGKARSDTNSKSQRNSEAMNRLANSGSLDDAARVLEGLID